MNKQIQKLNEVREYWKEELKNVITFYLYNKGGHKYDVLYIKDGRIKSIHPFSENKKNLPDTYMIRSNGDRYFYAVYNTDIKFALGRYLERDDIYFGEI